MIGSLGVPELLFILVLALLVFGPRKLPEIGRTLGRALGEFRRATSDLKRTLDVELTAEDLDLNRSAEKKPAESTARQAQKPAITDAGDDRARTPSGQTEDSEPGSGSSLDPS